eukprot:g11348.t1
MTEVFATQSSTLGGHNSFPAFPFAPVPQPQQQVQVAGTTLLDVPYLNALTAVEQKAVAPDGNATAAPRDPSAEVPPPVVETPEQRRERALATLTLSEADIKSNGQIVQHIGEVALRGRVNFQQLSQLAQRYGIDPELFAEGVQSSPVAASTSTDFDDYNTLPGTRTVTLCEYSEADLLVRILRLPPLLPYPLEQLTELQSRIQTGAFVNAEEGLILQLLQILTREAEKEQTNPQGRRRARDSGPHFSAFSDALQDEYGTSILSLASKRGWLGVVEYVLNECVPAAGDEVETAAVVDVELLERTELHLRADRATDADALAKELEKKRKTCRFRSRFRQHRTEPVCAIAESICAITQPVRGAPKPVRADQSDPRTRSEQSLCGYSSCSICHSRGASALTFRASGAPSISIRIRDSHGRHAAEPQPSTWGANIYFSAASTDSDTGAVDDDRQQSGNIFGSYDHRDVIEWWRRENTQLLFDPHVNTHEFDCSPRRKLKASDRMVAYVNRPNRMGWTALLLAAQSGGPAVCKKLLDSRADVDVEASATKLTPLMVAGTRSSLAIVELLLNYRADVWKMNVVGQSVVEIVKNKKHMRDQKLKFARIGGTGSEEGVLDAKGKPMDLYGIGGPISLEEGKDLGAIEELLLRVTQGKELQKITPALNSSAAK